MNTKTSIVLLACAGVLTFALTARSDAVRRSSYALTGTLQAAEGQWPSLGGDYTRSGMSPDEGLIEGAAEWTREIGGAVVGSATVGHDGRVHVACEDGRLYALDAGGAPLWTTDVNTPLLSAPSIGPDGRLFVGGRETLQLRPKRSRGMDLCRRR